MNDNDTNNDGEVRPRLPVDAKPLGEQNKPLEPKVDRMWHSLYIEAQADPLDGRTDVEFCEAIQLDVSTFRNWKQKYRQYIFKEVEARRKNYTNELRSKGHKALAKKLSTDTNAIKLLFQLLGDLVEKTEVRTELSDADKQRRIQTLTDSTEKRRLAWEQASGKGEDGTTVEGGPVGPITP